MMLNLMHVMNCTCRYGHGAMPLHDECSLVLYGGGDADEDRYEADLAVLDTRTWRWTKPAMQVHAALDKYHHVCKRNLQFLTA
jgi:hypothetical protein